jgi:hypothetical protein
MKRHILIGVVLGLVSCVALALARLQATSAVYPDPRVRWDYVQVGGMMLVNPSAPDSLASTPIPEGTWLMVPHVGDPGPVPQEGS